MLFLLLLETVLSRPNEKAGAQQAQAGAKEVHKHHKIKQKLGSQFRPKDNLAA